MTTEMTPCLVCKSAEFEPCYQVRDWACEVPGEFRLVKCCRCQHIYLSPRPSQDLIGTYYPDRYQPFRHAISEEPNPLTRALRHIQLRTRCHQISQLRGGGRLLDVGSSTGLFLNEMRRHGDWQLIGLEPNQRSADYAREVFGLEVFIGQVEEAPWASASFDVITLWDVLEHLPNPRTALLRIREFLTDDGWLIISVPNADSIDARLFGKYWIGLDPPRHMSVFSLRTLRRLLDEMDFELDKAYCFYGRYTTFALSIQQWLHAHQGRSARRRWLERLLFLPVWRYLTLPYFWTLDQLQLGTIITVRARPKGAK